MIASDECYSEIYFRDEPPLGSAAGGGTQLGRKDFKNLIALTSLSKRSNVPGLRSGFVAGDAALIKPFSAVPHLPRQRHEPGGAKRPASPPGMTRQHVVDNRAQYRAKFAQVTPLLAAVMDVALPDAGFYLWAKDSRIALPGARTRRFRASCLAFYNVVVLPGSYLAREAQGQQPRGRAASAWRWWPKPLNVLKPPRELLQFVESRAS